MSDLPVFCDFLKITYPKDQSEAVERAVYAFLSDYCMDLQSSNYIAFARGGIRFGQHGRVGTMQVSGGAIEAIRGQGEWGQFLAMLFDFDHRITLLDAALDVSPSNGSTSALLKALYAATKTGKHRLTRKFITPGQVSTVFAPGLGSSDTGTVYLGRRGTSEVYLKVYDKRQEIFDRTGVDQGSELVRYEVTVTGKLSPTLGDAYDPTRLFWSHVGNTVLKCPDRSLMDWKGHSEGYYLPPRKEVLPYQALVHRIEHSEDLKKIVALASECGDVGRHRLLRSLEEMISMQGRDSEITKAIANSRADI